MTFLTLLIITGGLYVGWNLGANDGANSMGTAVGAGVRTIREAVAIVAILGFLGAVLIGPSVVKTIGRGIVPLDQVDGTLALIIAVSAMFAGGLWITIATYLKIPVSTTHSVVGAVAGAGLAAGDVPVIWSRFGDIFIAWIFTPLGTALVAYVIYRLLRTILLRRRPVSDRTWGWLLTASGMYMAFSWGGNDVANATGLIVGAGIMEPFWAAALGGLAIAIGVATWGYKLMETVGRGITALGPAMAFVAELAAALNVHVYTLLGIPVSTTHAVIGAVFGVGLVHGRNAINIRTVRDIVIAWAATPIGAGLMAFVVFRVLRLVLGMGGVG